LTNEGAIGFSPSEDEAARSGVEQRLAELEPHDEA
jgi:hypothetical protein